MRSELKDYIASLNLGNIALSNEAPWNESGLELYLKNPRRIYIDVEQTATEPLIQTLSGLTIANTVTSVRVIFSLDAKQLPSNYVQLVDSLRMGKDITTVQGVNRRECDVTTSYVDDMLVTELEYRFTKLST